MSNNGDHDSIVSRFRRSKSGGKIKSKKEKKMVNARDPAGRGISSLKKELLKMNPYNEWTERTGDTATVFVTDKNGKVRKLCEWRLISDKKMTYTYWNEDGRVNTFHELDTTPEHFKKYILQEE